MEEWGFLFVLPYGDMGECEMISTFLLATYGRQNWLRGHQSKSCPSPSPATSFMRAASVPSLGSTVELALDVELQVSQPRHDCG